MYYELYIDVFFLENYMIDSLVLFTVKKILKLPGKGFRILIGAATGALLTCLVIVLNVPVFVRYVFFHCIINVLMILIAFNMTKAIQKFHALILLYIVSIMFGGVMYLFRPYMRNISMFYGIVVLTYFITNMFWKFVIRFQKQQRNICEVSIFTEKGKFELRALADTGNELRDPVSGEPIHVIGSDIAEKLLGLPKGERNIYGLTPEVIESWKIRYISYRTIAGENIMPVLHIEKIVIHLPEEQVLITPLLGICAEPVSKRQNYQLILNSDILGGTKYVSKISRHTTGEI